MNTTITPAKTVQIRIRTDAPRSIQGLPELARQLQATDVGRSLIVGGGYSVPCWDVALPAGSFEQKMAIARVYADAPRQLRQWARHGIYAVPKCWCEEVK